MADLRFPNINSCTISGRLTRQPELKYLQSGMAVMKIDVAFNRNFRKNNEWQKETGFVQVTLWDKLAEKMSEHLKKGSPVIIESYLKMESWTDKDSNNRSKLCLVAQKVHNLEKGEVVEQSQPVEEDEEY